MSKLQVEIVTPHGIFYSQELYLVNLPGIYGEFGVMQGHDAILVGLSAGLVTIYDDKMEAKEHIFITGGFVEVTEELATVLVEEAEYLKNYNLKDVANNLSELKSNLEHVEDEMQKTKLQKEIQVAEKLIEILNILKAN